MESTLRSADEKYHAKAGYYVCMCVLKNSYCKPFMDICDIFHGLVHKRLLKESVYLQECCQKFKNLHFTQSCLPESEGTAKTHMYMLAIGVPALQQLLLSF